MQSMAEHLELGPSASIVFTQEIADSMRSVARESDRGRTLPLLAAVTKKGNRWLLLFPETDAGNFSRKFAPIVPYAVIPVGAIFGAVYQACKKIYEGDEPDESKKKGSRP